jgi:hypothetical protein
VRGGRKKHSDGESDWSDVPHRARYHSHDRADYPRHLSWERGKNTRKTSEKSLKNGGKRRFFEGKSAISTFVYTTDTRAQTASMPRLASASPAASNGLLTANSRMERRFFGCDADSDAIELADSARNASMPSMP